MSETNNINEYINEFIDDKKDQWEEEITFTEVIEIPDPDKIRLEKPHWYKIKNIVAVFADMSGSTSVNVKKYRNPKTRGRVYEAFTGALVPIFKLFDVEVVDIQGDGVLGIWCGDKARYPAFAAAVTFKTYVNKWLADWVKIKTNDDVDIHVHIGMDEFEVYVKYIGLRGEMKNRVWAGEPVPIASKLCDLAERNELLVSQRLYEAFKLEEIYLSCGCKYDESGNRTNGDKRKLWEEIVLEDDLKELFGFETRWKLTSTWCDIHGSEFCRIIMDAQNK